MHSTQKNIPAIPLGSCPHEDRIVTHNRLPTMTKGQNLAACCYIAFTLYGRTNAVAINHIVVTKLLYSYCRATANNPNCYTPTPNCGYCLLSLHSSYLYEYVFTGVVTGILSSCTLTYCSQSRVYDVFPAVLYKLYFLLSISCCISCCCAV